MTDLPPAPDLQHPSRRPRPDEAPQPDTRAVGDDVDVYSFGKWYRGSVVRLGRKHPFVQYTTGSGKTRERAFVPLLIRTHEEGALDFRGHGPARCSTEKD